MTRLFVHVQYLKGVGHLQRVRLIAEAAAARGMDVHIASGGLPLPAFSPAGAHLHQLPALQAGPRGFADLRDEQGREVDERWLARRRDLLLALYAGISPDILLIESFPFGRRQFSFELIPLLEKARVQSPRPAIACSIRDILQETAKAGRAEETVSRVNDFFDTVLVHGDPGFARLEESFPACDAIASKIEYTGFVAAPVAAFEASPDVISDEVVVSAGGGAIGPALMAAALEARPMTPLADSPWRLIAGPHLPEDDYADLVARAGRGVTVERFREDFRSLLAGARLSISYAGYNTTSDILRAGVPAVLVSYSGPDGRESEQKTRAQKLARLGIASTLEDTELSAESLAAVISQVQGTGPAGVEFDLDGAERTADLLMAMGA